MRRSPGWPTGTFGTCLTLRRADRPGAPRGAAVGGALHRLPERARQGAPVIDQDLVGLAGDPGGRSAPRRRGRSGHPLVPFGSPDERVFLKAESLQSIGAFKIRGAYVAIAALSPDERSRGVITYSSGNHAQGVARAARLLGTTRSSSCRTTRRRSSASAWRPTAPRSCRRARIGRAPGTRGGDRGRARSRDHPAVRRRPDHRRPGHDRPRDRRGPADDRARRWCRSAAAGWRAASRPRSRACARTSGSSASSPSWRPTPATRWRPGSIVRWSAADVRGRSPTARGPRHSAPGPFAHLRAYLDGIVTVTEAEIAAGVRLAAERSRLVVEPSGALPIAALAFHRRRAGRRSATVDVVAVVSGGNVDPVAYRDLPRGAAPGLSVGARSSPGVLARREAVGEPALADPDLGQLCGRPPVARGPRRVPRPATSRPGSPWSRSGRPGRRRPT